MSLLRRAERRSFLGWPTGTVVPTNGQTVPSNSQLSGQDPGVDGSLRLGAVWACVRLLADVISTLPVDVYERAANGRQNEISPAPEAIANPSAQYLPTQWRYQAMVSLLTRGNAYAYIARRDRLGYALQLEPIHPDLMTVQVDPSTGDIMYSANGHRLQRDDVWHLPAFLMPGWPIGLSPIAYAAVSINIGRSAERFGADFFDGGGHPHTILYSSNPTLNETQAKDAKQAYLKATAGQEPAVLGSGWDAKQIQIAPNESQFLETMQHNATAIARIFGVPPEMIGAGVSGSSVTYANREQRAQDFLTFCVNGWLVRLEESLSSLLPAGQFVKFNTGALLRSDLLTRYRSYDLAIKGGWGTPNDALRSEDQPTFEGGDQHLWPPQATSHADLGGGSLNA